MYRLIQHRYVAHHYGGKIKNYSKMQYQLLRARKYKSTNLTRVFWFITFQDVSLPYLKPGLLHAFISIQKIGKY